MKIATAIIASAAIVVGCSKDPFSKAQAEYITGCASSGVPEELCECSFEKLAAEFGKQEIVYAYNTQQLPPGYAEKGVEYLQVCMSE